jgi:predicted metal-dependent peptidase
MEIAMFNLEDIKKKVLRKYPAFRDVANSVKYKPIYSADVNTASTDGVNPFYNPDYMDSIDEDEQVFVVAHEFAHIACNHINRRKDKYPKLWNIATDAVINANLKNDGLKQAKNTVDIKNAILYDAETIYEQLVEKAKKKRDEKRKKLQDSNVKVLPTSKNENKIIKEKEKTLTTV